MPITIGVPAEVLEGEKRVALDPSVVSRLVNQAKVNVVIQKDAGKSAHFLDTAYTDATIVDSADDVYAQADVILKVAPPTDDEVAKLKEGQLFISHLDPYRNGDTVKALAAKNVTSIAMELIPRTSRAQAMDSLSSQASLAGYKSTLQAAQLNPGFFPMLTTAAGTIRPAKVIIVGAGVAGLQAIATAKRLGARVEAFDTRAVVAEQVQSLGAKFVEIDLGETGQTDQGYAKALTEEQIELQKQGQAKVIAQSDIVITTAQLFGRPAPQIVSREMVEAMRPGSVVVDMAVESGGNVEGSKLDEVVDINGVKVIGIGNLPSEVSRNASEMYSNNLFNLLDEFWDSETKTLNLDPEDDIVQNCVITRDGEIVNETIKNL